MAVDNTNVIDGMAIDKEKNAICLLLTDHLPWNVESSMNEHDHLVLLQDKINAYISYLETKQYEETYPEANFDMAVIEIHFKYEITQNCENFLNAVQNQIGQYGILIKDHIG